jgi:hypothetical protein
MRTTPGPKPIREALEVHLLDRVEHLDHRPRNDLVLQRRDPQRPQPPIGLRDLRPPARGRPIPPRRHPLMQISQTSLQIPPVIPPRHPIHPGRRLRADRPVRRPQSGDADVVHQRGKPRTLIPPYHLTHTTQRTRRTLPGAVSGMPFAGRVPLGSPPFLPHLPQPQPCSAGSQVLQGDPTSPARASQAYHIMFPQTPPPSDQPGGRAWDLPVLAHGGSLHAMVLETARGPPAPRDNTTSDIAFRFTNNVGTPNSQFRGSIARPAHTPVNASPRPHGTSTHDSEPPWIANPST